MLIKDLQALIDANPDKDAIQVIPGSLHVNLFHIGFGEDSSPVYVDTVSGTVVEYSDNH